MGYSSSVYQTAYRIMEQRRMDNQSALLKRQEEIYTKIPRAEQIGRELSSCGISAARAVISGGNAAVEIEKLKQKSLALQTELAALLTDSGYPENYLEPSYRCPICKDKGTYEDEAHSKTVVCDCFRQLLTKTACEELNRHSPLSLSTFDSFCLDYYSKEAENGSSSPYTRMTRIFEFCRQYADEFGAESASLFMTGATGLGKTHLSLAIANEVTRKGFGVIYTSAPSVLSELEKLHFSYSYQQENETAETLTECDLLIIDDLATEFSSSYSKAALYNIFNGRILKSKPTIINTNLSFKELEAFYSPRFVSRLYGEFVKLDFIGKDVRVASKQGKPPLPHK